MGPCCLDGVGPLSLETHPAARAGIEGHLTLFSKDMFWFSARKLLVFRKNPARDWYWCSRVTVRRSAITTRREIHKPSLNFVYVCGKYRPLTTVTSTVSYI